MKTFKINSKSIISRDNICVKNYLRDVSRIELLTPAEEKRLATLIKEGGRKAQEARELLVKANLRFVISVANSYSTAGMDLCDLIEEGNIGLIKAAENFDVKMGVRFTTFAVWYIRQSIQDAIMHHRGIVHLPANQHRILSAYLSKREEVLKTTGRDLSVEDYAKKANISAGKLNYLLNASRKADSLNVTLGDGSSTTYLDMLPSDNRTDSDLDRSSWTVDLKRVFNNVLSDREAYVVCHHYGIGCTQETLTSIGSDMGLSCERTRQINRDAMKKLQRSSEVSCLAGYLAA